VRVVGEGFHRACRGVSETGYGLCRACTKQGKRASGKGKRKACNASQLVNQAGQAGQASKSVKSVKQPATQSAVQRSTAQRKAIHASMTNV